MNGLQEIEAWLQREVAPQAEKMDVDSATLFHAFHQLGDRNLLALRLPQQEGGQNWNEPSFYEFQVLLASYSGALAFLTTQHQSALRMLSASHNTPLKLRLQPSLIQGTIGMGVGFSHLRRSGPPMMSATPLEPGYELSGTVPWVTGMGCFDGFICGARLPNQDILTGWIPLTDEHKSPRYQVSPPMKLAAMASTQTVEVRLDQWIMDPTEVIAIHDSEWLQRKDKVNTLHHGFYALGSANAALRLMSHLPSSMDAQIQDTIASLHHQYQQCYAQMLDLLPHRQKAPAQCLAAKANAIQLAGRCAQAAIAAAGGQANVLGHPAQRIYREVLAFTVFGQTPDSRKATLAALSSF